MRAIASVVILSLPAVATADVMREMSTDRPDTTESPISVDAGHVQVELDLFVLGIDRAAFKTSTFDVAAANMKLGVSDRVDLQLVVEPYHRERIGQPGGDMVSAGYGGTTGRAKINLWGNDGGDTAGALLPFVSRAGGVWGAGLAVPVGFSLPGDFGAAVMGQIEVGDIGGANEMVVMGTATCSHDVYGPVGAYVESAIATSGTTAADVAVQADGGVTVGVNDDVQVDVGTRIGVLGDVPDIEVFLGLSARR